MTHKYLTVKTRVFLFLHLANIKGHTSNTIISVLSRWMFHFSKLMQKSDSFTLHIISRNQQLLLEIPEKITRVHAVNLVQERDPLENHTCVHAVNLVQGRDPLENHTCACSKPCSGKRPFRKSHMCMQ